MPKFPLNDEQDIDLLQASALMRVDSLVEIDFRNWCKLGVDVALSVLDRGTAPRILVQTN